MSESIENMIYWVQGHRVMLDADLARLYGVATKNLNKALKRNADRFPEDFAFQLTQKEWDSLRSQFATFNENTEANLRFQNGTSSQKSGGNLRSQIVISSLSYGGRRYLPYAFTEHGVVMLANILRSKHAVKMSIQVVRAFIRLKQILTEHKDMAKNLDELRSFVLKHSQKSDQEFRKVWKAIETLSNPPKNQRQIGFDLG